MSDRLSSLGDWRNLFAAVAAIAIFGFAFGMTFPLLSLLLESRGVSEKLIGFNAAMAPIGVLLSSAIIPILARRFGSRNVAVVAAGMTSVLLISFKVFENLPAWFILRFLQGVSISILFVLSESWVVKYSDSAKRGRIVAVYGVILSASFGAGPLLIGIIGIEGWAPFVIGACVIAAGMLPLSMVRDEVKSDQHHGKPHSVLTFLPKAPVLLLAVFTFAVFDAATLNLIPVYGVRLGFDLTTSTNMLTALILGNVALQFPIGLMADRFSKRSVLTGCGLITGLMCLVVPFVMGMIWMWPALMIMGATGYGMYTVALASLGDRFTGDELVTGNSAFASMWGSGALIGSVLGGWGMEGFGPHGLLYVLFATFVAFLFAVTIRSSTTRQ